MVVDMQYQPSFDQRELMAGLDPALAAILPVPRLHAEPMESAGRWTDLDQLGIFDLARDEDAGGAGLGAVEEALLVTALGRQLASSSVLATLGSAHARTTAATSDIGRVTAAFRGRQGIAMIEDRAARTVLLRAAGDAALHVLPGAAPALADNPWLEDMTRPAGLGAAIGTFDVAGLRRLRLIDAAALAGLADAALASAVDYAKLREQFGRPIGSFQAVKHHCANMAVAARGALDLVTFAAVAIDNARPDADFLVDSAFVRAATAALDNAGKNIQIHGGIGFSEEADAHLFLKRAQLLIAIGGGVEAAIDRLGAPADTMLENS